MMSHGMPATLCRPLALACLAIGICAFARGAGAAIPADLVKVEMVADVATIQPGQSFEVGVLFHIKPAWHIYWKNPGDSGLPTRIQWHLPEGFTASELRFPIPRRIELPGDIINYGYEDEVLLKSIITPPKELTAASVELSADASWLVCEKICVAGKGSASLSLPVGGEPKPANKQLFDDWAGKFPTPIVLSSATRITAKPLDLSTGDGVTDIVTDSKSPGVVIPDAVDGLEITMVPRTPNPAVRPFPSMPMS